MSWRRVASATGRGPRSRRISGAATKRGTSCAWLASRDSCWNVECERLRRPKTIRIVQRTIRRSEELLWRDHRRIVERVTGGELEQALRSVCVGSRERVTDARDERLGALLVGVREERDELIAAVARGHVHGARLRRECTAEQAERLIARDVAEAVVVFLEPVQIEHHGGQPAPALGGRELAGEVALELA